MKKRSEKEMLDMILSFAKEDERVRAVIMNGSRASTGAVIDEYSDFDIVYYVTDIKSFTSNHKWVDIFGERVIMQMPDLMVEDNARENSFAYLMQFSDGNRIDLTLEILNESHVFDSQSVLLLDKDNKITLPPASDKDYLPKPPTETDFYNCCNEFWWVSVYVAKGIKRKELIYAKLMQDRYVRDMLIEMLCFKAAYETDFKVSFGKGGKYLYNYMSAEDWKMYENTYSGSNFENIFSSLFAMCELFRKTAREVAEFYNYTYPEEDDKKTFEYLGFMKDL